jgi:uncharacterized protein YaaQ
VRLLLIILGDVEAEAVVRKLVEAGLRVTRLASTGGFLRRGNATLMMGVEEAKVEEALGILRAELPPAVTAGVRRATIFVLNVARYEQL